MPELNLSETFIATLQVLSKWLESEDVPYIAIGGIAVSLTAQPRTTQDIDILIWLENSKWETFLTAGKQYGFEFRVSEGLAFAARSRVLLLKHSNSGISVDISCGSLPFEQEAIDRAKTLTIGAFALKIPTPEDLIITKAVAQRAKDLIDIESIINTNQNLDLARIRYWVKEFADILEMPEMLANINKLLTSNQTQSKSKSSKKVKTINKKSS